MAPDELRLPDRHAASTKARPRQQDENRRERENEETGIAGQPMVDDRALQYFIRVMHGHTNTVRGPGATAHRFYVAMCEMARATQQHSWN